MTYFPEGTTSPLARAVAAEIRSLIGVRRISGRKLARLAGYTSHNYVAERLRDEKPFAIVDVERIAEVLDEDPAQLIARARSSHGPRLIRDGAIGQSGTSVLTDEERAAAKALRLEREEKARRRKAATDEGRRSDTA